MRLVFAKIHVTLGESALSRATLRCFSVPSGYLWWAKQLWELSRDAVTVPFIKEETEAESIGSPCWRQADSKVGLEWPGLCDGLTHGYLPIAVFWLVHKSCGWKSFLYWQF